MPSHIAEGGRQGPWQYPQLHPQAQASGSGLGWDSCCLWCPHLAAAHGCTAVRQEPTAAEQNHPGLGLAFSGLGFPTVPRGRGGRDPRDRGTAQTGEGQTQRQSRTEGQTLEPNLSDGGKDAETLRWRVTGQRQGG